MKILDGKALANKKAILIKEELKKLSFTPKLVIVLVGDDFASLKYVGHKLKKAEALGINAELVHLPKSTTQDELIKQIQKLNNDKSVHGYIVQLPVPKHIDDKLIQEYVDPSKDVDGLSTMNAGRFFQSGYNYIVPGTPSGIVQILKDNDIPLKGKVVAMIGRSNIVGKPLSLALLNENATVIMCHSRTDFKILKQADIVISATGVPHLIKANMIKENATIIDVGINRDKNNKLTGDVDFEDVKDKAYAVTPVPGGVGPMTIICIFQNLLKLIKFQQNK